MEGFSDDDGAPAASKPDDNEENCAAVEYTFNDLQRCFMWRHFLDSLQADVLVAHGVSDQTLLHTRNNSSEGLPCAVVVAHNGEYAPMFVTKSFEVLTGLISDEATKVNWTEALLPSDLSLNERINKEGIQKVEEFCAAAQEHTNKVSAQPVRTRVFLLGKSLDRVYWLLLEIAAVRFNSSLHLLFVLWELTMPSLATLEPSQTCEDALRLLLVRLRAKLQTHAEIKKTSVVARLLEDEAFAWLRSGRGEDHSLQRRNSLTRQGTTVNKQEFKGKNAIQQFLAKCDESMHYAHRLFFSAHENVDASRILGAAAASLGIRNKDSDYDAVAWVVADSAADFPLIHVSKGFTQLTGYPITHVLGKNCRFLQPLDRSKNEAINLGECTRLKQFCAARQADSKIVSLLLNQDAYGHFFWNLLVLLQVSVDLKTYVVGTLTKLSSLSHELTSILTNFDSRSLSLVEALREAVLLRDSRFSPLPWHMESNESVLEECVIGWMEDCGRGVPELWEGDHFAPPIGGLSANLFGDCWISLLEVVEACAGELRPLQEHVISKTAENMPGGISFCVSDLCAADCPLVFVSKEFENITGYDANFALGRNCRFLLPNDQHISDQVNGDELQHMKAFVDATRQQGKHQYKQQGTIVSLFVYERRGGKRFWCLSNMCVGKVAGHLYIVAVQLDLPCGMPSLLETRLSSVIGDGYDDPALNDFCIATKTFLSQLCPQVRQQDRARRPQDISVFMQRSIVEWMTLATDDFDGDLHVVRSGRAAVYSFEFHRKWERLISELAKNEATANLAGALLSDINIPCAVSDAVSPGCPVVYMSKGFEKITGYSQEWALGRNCRFLQPKLAYWNDFVNISERRRVLNFCELPPKPGHLTSLLLNETSEGSIFLNLLVLRHVNVEGHPYILSVQTHLKKQLPLVSELLLRGIDGIDRIQHLRNLIYDRVASHPTDSLPSVVEVSAKRWVKDVPVSTIMRLATTPPDVCTSTIPPIGVELTQLSDLHLALPAAIKEGIRHIVFNFTSCSGDALQAQLFHLRIVDVLGSMRKQCLHYLRTLAFSIKARPGQEDVCTECVTSVQKAGVHIALWLLDSSGLSIADCLTSWQHLARAQDNGDVAQLGIFGSSGNLHAVQKAVSLKFDALKISVLALDLSPSTIFDKKQNCDQITTILQGSKPVMLFGIYGYKNNLVQDRGIHAIAEGFDTDPCMVLMKWAEGLGCLCVVPWLRSTSDAPNGFLPDVEAIDPRIGTHAAFLADYCRLEKPRPIMNQIASLRPPDLKSNLIWFGSVCRNDLTPSQVSVPRGKNRKPSTVSTGAPDRDGSRRRSTGSVQAQHVHHMRRQSARNVSNTPHLEDNIFEQERRRRRSVRTEQPTVSEGDLDKMLPKPSALEVQEPKSNPTSGRVVRRRSAGNMSNLASLEETMSTQERRSRGRSKELPAMNESEVSRRLYNPSQVETTKVDQIPEDVRTCAASGEVNVSSSTSDVSVVDLLAQAKEGSNDVHVVSKVSTENELRKLSGTDLTTAQGGQNERPQENHETFQGSIVGVEASRHEQHRLIRRHSTEAVSDKIGKSDVPWALDRKAIRRRSTHDAIPAHVPPLSNGELQTSFEKQIAVERFSDRPNTLPAIKRSTMEVDSEPADLSHGNDDCLFFNDKSTFKSKEESNTGTLMLQGLIRPPMKRRDSARNQLLMGMFRMPTLEAEAASTSLTSKDNQPSPKRVLDPLPVERPSDTTSTQPNQNLEPPKTNEDSTSFLSQSLQARRDEIVAQESSPCSTCIAGFGVSKAQELTQSESAEQTMPARSRPLLPFGPQVPVAPPRQTGRRPSRF